MQFKILISALFLLTFLACKEEEEPMTTPEPSNTEKAQALIQAFETGSTDPLAYVSDDTYLQHNLAFPSGKGVLEGLLTGSPTGFTVDIHRTFSEGDIVFMHNTYGGTWNNGTPQVAFDIFRFENGLIVEHWDNLQDEVPATQTVSGRSMVDGPTTEEDSDQTAGNKAVVREFIETVLMAGQGELTDYISSEQYDQHNPGIGDGLEGLGIALQFFAENNLLLQYDELHQLHGAGNFVLSVSEGLFLEGDHVAYYDLFRLKDGKIVEHWDVVQTIPPQEEWQNQNGKF